MTKLQREGLERLLRVGPRPQTPQLEAAVSWIRRQLALDDARRTPRGKYRRSPTASLRP